MVDVSGELNSENELDGLLTTSSTGQPVYLRDLVTTQRGYASPPVYLNRYTRRGPTGESERTRAVTLDVFMRSGTQIGDFGDQVDSALADLRRRLKAILVRRLDTKSEAGLVDMNEIRPRLSLRRSVSVEGFPAPDKCAAGANSVRTIRSLSPLTLPFDF